ncbi:MAG: DUF5615 family PIN-like protein [Anaerolineae bacterium]
MVKPQTSEMVARLHFDENVDIRLARELRQRGYDVSTTPEAGLRSCSDEEQLAYATSQCRILATRNITHFPGIYDEWWEQGREHAGIIVIVSHPSVGEMLRKMETLLNRYTAQELHNIFFSRPEWLLTECCHCSAVKHHA